MLMKNDNAANESAKRALALEPNNVQARLAMIDLSLRRGDTDEADGRAQAAKGQPVLAGGLPGRRRHLAGPEEAGTGRARL
ncbi:hypothetical protein LP420_18945 [Massilia sp. B-10]|nr:hypothetical protein LP420_18945 [Massilia sp. B-10]